MLKWLTISLLADPITALLVPEPRGTIFRATFMLAIPVMAGSTSYALSEARGKPEGLDLKLRQGRYFYGVIAASMVIGLSLDFIGVNPIQALVFAAVFNGVIAVPLIWFVNRIAADRRVMGDARSGWLSRVTLIITFIGMAGAVVAMAISYIKG